MEKLISRSLHKSCKAYPISTSLLKEALPLLIEILTAIVNLSMQSGVFPESPKEALVKPPLKKITLELFDRNYRPVSNLQFTGKLIEHAVTDQLNETSPGINSWNQCNQHTGLVTAWRQLFLRFVMTC